MRSDSLTAKLSKKTQQDSDCQPKLMHSNSITAEPSQEFSKPMRSDSITAKPKKKKLQQDSDCLPRLMHSNSITADPSQNFSRPMRSDSLTAKLSKIFSVGGLSDGAARGSCGVGASLLGAGLHLSGTATSDAGGVGRGGASADVDAVERKGRRPDPLSLLTPGGLLKRQLDESLPSAANQLLLLSPSASLHGSGSRIVGGVRAFFTRPTQMTSRRASRRTSRRASRL